MTADGYSCPDDAAVYDFLFVGAGASTSYTILGLLDALATRPPSTPVRIAVVERGADPFAGLPYGVRAAPTCLLITALRDFLPDGERAAFVAWLAVNKGWVFDEFIRAGGEHGALWWRRHRAAIDRDEFDDLYLPRYVFGEYLARRTAEQISRAGVAGVAETTVVTDEARCVRSGAGEYLVDCERRRLVARHVVLAVGSPSAMPRLAATAADSTALLVDDPFEDMPDTLRRVRQLLGETAARPPHVVVLGSNASAMDMIYQISNLTTETSQRPTFTVLSPRGDLPARIEEPVSTAPFHAERLVAMAKEEPIRAVAVYQAAVADIDRGKRLGLSPADTLSAVSHRVIELVARLSDDEALEFAARWGAELGRHQRRAGLEYWEVVDQLVEDERFELVAGSFVGLMVDCDGGTAVRYRSAAGVEQTLPRPADVIVNCAGPAKDLQSSAPAVIEQMLRDGVCSATRFGAGIAVDSGFTAAPGLSVMGPLLAGNLVDGNPVWHMEHCGRVSAYGRRLGSILADTVTTA